MNYVTKLPMLLAVAAAIVAGLIGYKQGHADKMIYINMMVAMVLFYIIGLVIRSTIVNTIEQIEEKIRLKEQAERLEELERIEQEKREKIEASKENESNNPHKGNNVDIAVGDEDTIHSNNRAQSAYQRNANQDKEEEFYFNDTDNYEDELGIDDEFDDDMPIADIIRQQINRDS